MSHFIIFGASFYYHVSKNLRKKLEPTIELGVFVGYIETPHDFEVYLNSLRMIAVRRDVKLNEEKAMSFYLE